MHDRTLDPARALAHDVALALRPLHCRGHLVDVPGCAAPTFAEARRFLEMALWMLWRVPHVMLVPCVAGGRPAVLVGTWDPRGVALRQTVTDAAVFRAEVAAATAALAARHGDDDRAALADLCREDPDPPDLEHLEFWPEVLRRIRAAPPDAATPPDPGAAVAAPIAERLWAARLEDVR